MTNKVAATATHSLTMQVSDAKETTLAVNLGEAIKPLRMGGVTFYGESARVIRDAQTVLKTAGAGQLEVVKHANEPGEPFVVSDGQVFINEATIKPSRFEVKLVRGANGQYHVVGFGLGLDRAAGKTATAPLDAGQLLSEITKQISESELGTDLESRIAQIELSLVAEQGQKNAAEILLEQRLAALESGVRALKLS